MEPWVQALMGVGAMLTPVVIAAFARDRALMTMMTSQASQLHERVNRTREEFVRRDDMAEHMQRLDKQLDDMRGDMRRMTEEIRHLIAGGGGRSSHQRSES